MGMNERIILIDADVVSHFIYASEILSINTIFKYKIKVLDKVYAELQRFPKKKKEVENLIQLKIIKILPFPEEDSQIKREYAYIKKVLFKGEGESACMAVARYSDSILASSNLKDIKHYCELHKITYLTTMDFLCEAISTKKWTLQRCNDFIVRVKAAGSKLPVDNMSQWKCRKLVI